MKRIALGTALGVLAVYLYDPELGENRRDATRTWRQMIEATAWGRLPRFQSI